MSNRELWEQVMERTEEEILTNCYTISFGFFDQVKFPRPADQKKTFTSKSGRRLTDFCRKVKRVLRSALHNFSRQQSVLLEESNQ